VSESKTQEGVATGILGKKLGMTQVFINDERVPVTVIQAGPCVVVQVKTEETDGYNAVQLGMDEKKQKRTTRPLQGHFAKAGVTPKKLVREFRAASAVTLEPGQEVGASVLEGAKLVDVEGVSKGKGFAGVIKRWNFGGGRASHGNTKYHRMPGSLGRTYSVHKGVPKNRKGPGRLGGEKVTARGLKLIEIDAERNIVLVKGPVPGANGSYVIVRRSVKDPSRKQPKGQILY
jgi:large subunit ribosomal protein L3